MSRGTLSKCTRLLRAAGYEAKQITEVDGLHYVTVSDTFRGKLIWTDRIEAGLLHVTDDPHLVAVIKAAALEARRGYLVAQMVELEAASR